MSPPAVSPAISSGRCRHLSSGFRPLRRRDVRGTERREIQKCKNKTFLYQTISHTFCPECFVLCPACIFTVLSAWKLRNVHGVQKASL
ncbi:unnamed protein product [Staurois parvus]|uniref:Uncharacterized protein n=1 Tax=Staurois parvus TaxID=386267 RepID=A0ABN9A7H8_9NEOB|nr:unnamed protein product [Staurois parvus]